MACNEKELRAAFLRLKKLERELAWQCLLNVRTWVMCVCVFITGLVSMGVGVDRAAGVIVYLFFCGVFPLVLMFISRRSRRELDIDKAIRRRER